MRALKKVLASYLEEGLSTHRRAKVGFFALLFGGVCTVAGVGAYVLDTPFRFQAWLGVSMLLAGLVLIVLELRARRRS